MPRILTDGEIDNLLLEEKPLPGNWETMLERHQKQNNAFCQGSLEVRGVSGKIFRIIVRQAINNLEDFSIILVFTESDGTEYRLSRFNGRHPSNHTNRFEKRYRLADASFRDAFHIHRATERYQLEGLEIDGYADPTTTYNSFDSALRTFLDFFNFTRPMESLPLLDSLGGNRP